MSNFHDVCFCPTDCSRPRLQGAAADHRAVTSTATHLLCLLSSEGEQEVSRLGLQRGALTESDAAGPHGVHRLAATFPQIPHADLHVAALTAPPQTQNTAVGVCRLKTDESNPGTGRALPSSPDEGVPGLQRADPDDRATSVTFHDPLSPPGVQVPDMDGTHP